MTKRKTSRVVKPGTETKPKIVEGDHGKHPEMIKKEPIPSEEEKMPLPITNPKTGIRKKK